MRVRGNRGNDWGVPLQVQLYEDFAKSRAKASVDESISTASAEEEEKPKLKATGHVFQVGAPPPPHVPHQERWRNP